MDDIQTCQIWCKICGSSFTPKNIKTHVEGPIHKGYLRIHRKNFRIFFNLMISILNTTENPLKMAYIGFKKCYYLVLQ